MSTGATTVTYAPPPDLRRAESEDIAKAMDEWWAEEGKKLMCEAVGQVDHIQRDMRMTAVGAYFAQWWKYWRGHQPRRHE